jgi:DNA-binding HxlR family transcriptional regulator
MSASKITLSAEMRKLVEARIDQTLKGIEETIMQVVEKQGLAPDEIKSDLESLEETFSILFQKWSLEILYSLFLKSILGFGDLKKALGVNSRTLSDKLKLLKEHGYLERNVTQGPPLRVDYMLTTKGRNTVLLAIPLLYYTSST